jgi:hypothetical protein
MRYGSILASNYARVARASTARLTVAPLRALRNGEARNRTGDTTISRDTEITRCRWQHPCKARLTGYGDRTPDIPG